MSASRKRRGSSSNGRAAKRADIDAVDSSTAGASPAPSEASAGAGAAPSASPAPSKETVTLQATSRIDPENGESIPVTVSKAEHELYEFQPQHYGPNVIYYNARNPDYYSRQLPRAKATVWILVRADTRVNGYVVRRLVEAGTRKNVQMKVMTVTKFNLILTKDSAADMRYDGQEVELPDCVIPRIGAAGADHFALAVLRHIERLGPVILNDMASIAIARDKLSTLQVAAARGLPVPTTVLAKMPIDVDFVADTFQFPLILKKSSGSQGKGVMKVESRDQLADVADMLDTSTPMIFQEFVRASTGRDLRVFVVGGKVVASMMRIASTGFKANVHQGGNVRGISVSGACEWLCLEVVKALGLEIAGVDLLIDEHSYKICEVNSSPGFDGLEKATGIDVAASTVDYVKFRMGILRKKKGANPDLELDAPVSAAHRE